MNRNLRIYKNILNIDHDENDRILVVMGATHIAALHWFFQCSPTFELVKFNDLAYIKGSKFSKGKAKVKIACKMCGKDGVLVIKNKELNFEKIVNTNKNFKLDFLLDKGVYQYFYNDQSNNAIMGTFKANPEQRKTIRLFK